MGDVFAALADPTRREILDIVSVNERSVTDIVGRFAYTQSGISKQLRILHDAGLVSVRQDGRRRMYALRADALAEIEAWVEKHRRHLSARLDALEEALDAKHGKRK